MTVLTCPTCPATVTVFVPVIAAGHTCPGRSHRRKDERISTFRPAQPTTTTQENDR